MAKNLAERMGAQSGSRQGNAIQEVPRSGRPTNSQSDARPKTLFDLIKEEREEFASVLPQGYDVDQFIRDAITYIQMNPDMRACTPFSVLGALMSCAQLGLRPGVMGQSYLGKRYNNMKKSYEATFLIGYKGLVELAYRSLDVASIVSRVAYERDQFEVAYGLHEDIIHRPYMGERGRPIAYYCIVRLRNGDPLFTVMSQVEMEAFQKKYGSTLPSSPWVQDFEAMAMKTVLRQLSKWMPKSTAFGVALAVDDSIRNDLEGDIVHTAVPVGQNTPEDEEDAFTQEENNIPPQQPRNAAPRASERGVNTQGAQQDSPRIPASQQSNRTVEDNTQYNQADNTPAEQVPHPTESYYGDGAGYEADFYGDSPDNGNLPF